MAVVVSVNRAGIQQVLHGEGPGGHVHRYVRRLGREGAALAKANAPRRTGRLARSITASPIYDGPRVVRIKFGASVRYALWQELGTGPIRPVRKQVLAFPGGRLAGPTRSGRLRPRTGRTVFTRYTRGVPAAHYLRDALIELGRLHPELGIRILRS